MTSAVSMAVRWLHAWGISRRIAFPALLVALPLVRRLTALIVAPSGSP